MKPAILEDHVEQASLAWFAALWRQTAHGPDLSPPDAKTPGTERDTYRAVLLSHRLRDAIKRLNPHVPVGAQDEACRMMLNLNIPGLVQANRPVATLPEMSLAAMVKASFALSLPSFGRTSTRTELRDILFTRLTARKLRLPEIDARLEEAIA